MQTQENQNAGTEKPTIGYASSAVLTVEELKAVVHFTQKERDYLVARAVSPQKLQMGSSQDRLVDKISDATGWEKMKPIQLFCRFVYKHGLAKA